GGGLAPMRKLRALLGGVLLLIAGNCFAEDEWPADLRKELAGLSESGRTAFNKALIACALYVDEPDKANYENVCKVAANAFSVEFKNGYSPISLSFDQAIILTRGYKLAEEILINKGRGAQLWQELGRNPAKDMVATLQKAYHETGPRAASVTTAP